ncbi:unnamed protein product [Camellia sinensis]
MPSKLKKAIGAVKDQTSISLAKVSSNNSSNIEVSVLKATTHDSVPVEERYVHEILQLVSSDKAQAAACARAIGKRIGRTRNWIVAIKSLMLVLRIFQDGDPYFPREVLHAMKRGAKILNLSSFRDDSNSSPWDYTAFIRTFALYLDERLDCFLTGKLQRRYTHHEKEPFHRRSRRANEPVRNMKPAMLLDKISYWQRLLDRAVATRPTGAAKTNRLVQISLYAVVQESFDLYKDISDGLALLLDSFFHLQYNSCVNAFQACVKATKQFEELSGFYDLCKNIGVGRTSEYPSVQKISEELIETLQEFLKDQSSFPTTGRSPNRPQLLLPAPPCDGSTTGRRHDSCMTEFTDTSEMTSEFGSQCTSLEDLISATELTGKSPSISIDLEAYSIADQFEKQLQRDDAFSANDDAGSTQSLPVMSSTVDLVSLEEWPQKEQEIEKVQEEEEQQKPLEPSSTTGWELVLAEVATTSSQPSTNGFDTFLSQEQELTQIATTLTKPFTDRFDPFLSKKQEHKQATTSPQPFTNAFNSFLSPEQEQKPSESGSRDGWELVLAEIATPSTQPPIPITEAFSVSSKDNLYHQSSVPPSTRQPIPITEAFNVSSIDNLYHQSSIPQQSSVPPPDHYYNPFLQDTTELTAIATVTTPTPIPTTTATDFEASFPANDGFSWGPTFQATPTFSAQNPNSPSMALQNENDPFASYPIGGDEQGFSGSTNQQNLLHEQQLWLQQQNKIIARHTA